MLRVRLDKWLWAARFFKTRALATHACDLGRIEWNGHPSKPSREVHPGDRLTVTNEAGIFHLDVLAVSLTRGPAATAQTLYHESEESWQARLELAEERKSQQRLVGTPPGKPSKHDRRKIERLRNRD